MSLLRSPVPADRTAASLQQARAALRRGDVAACAQLADAALRVNAALPEAHFLLGMALAETGRINAALPAVERAVSLARSNAEYAAQHARLLILLRREAEARAAADHAARCPTDDPLVLDTIGCTYARLGDHGAAVPLFERAVAAMPANVTFRFNLASSYGFFGRTDDAEAQYEAMLAHDPGHGRAHLGLAGLRRQKAERNHTARLETAIGAQPDPVERLRIHYAAAKEYEDLGRHEDVFRHLSTANAAHRKRLGFSMESDEHNATALREAFADPAYFAGESTLADAPIFVVGMPRTGTTLVDRILAAHPQVESVGELQAMPLALKRLSQSPSRMVLDPETIAGVRSARPEDLGRAYLDRARQHAGGEAPIFVDKFPLNFLYAGHIARALPNARIVCLRRHPLDAVWSNYKNLFATTSPYYGWSYDLVDAARYYALFDGLVALWRDLFPGPVLELGYEALIADQEGETRRLLDHCGLPWDDACLSFHTASGAVATPSAQQVRRPLNADSVQRWRHYEAHLGPARAWLEQAGIACD